MSKGLLLDADEFVANWAFAHHNRFPTKFDRALGIIDNGQLVGAAIFSSYNSANVDFSYYGKSTITLGIIRALVRIGLYELQLSRCTVIVPKRPSFLTKKLHKFGFRYEGVQRRFYGPTDSARHTGCRFVLFREDMEKMIPERFRKVA